LLSANDRLNVIWAFRAAGFLAEIGLLAVWGFGVWLVSAVLLKPALKNSGPNRVVNEPFLRPNGIADRVSTALAPPPAQRIFESSIHTLRARADQVHPGRTANDRGLQNYGIDLQS
jgi:hypothetical protein